MPRSGGRTRTGVPFETAGRGPSGVDSGDGCVDSFLTFSASCCIGALVSSGHDDESVGLKGVYSSAEI